MELIRLDQREENIRKGARRRGYSLRPIITMNFTRRALARVHFRNAVPLFATFTPLEKRTMGSATDPHVAQVYAKNHDSKSQQVVSHGRIFQWQILKAIAESIFSKSDFHKVPN